MQTTAQMLWAYNLTGQSSWTSVIGAAGILPTLFLGAWGGSLADRVPKRGLIFLTQFAFLVQALLLTGLAYGLFGEPSPWHLLALATASGLINAVDVPARMAFVMEMVDREDVVNAVALNAVLFNLARTTGPAVAGVLMRWSGPGPCFLINALSYVAVLAALWAMGPTRGEAIPRRHENRSLWDGVRFLLQRPDLTLVILLGGAMAGFGWPTLTLFPALSDREYGAGDNGAGAFLCCIGLGALLASLIVASFATMARRRLFLGAGVLLTSASLLGLSVAPSVPIAMLCCVTLGCGLIFYFSTGQAILQLGAGDHNRGLVLGIWTMILSGAVPLGQLATGPAADRWSVPPVLAAQGLGILTAAFGILLLAIVWRDKAKEGCSP
jgi:predicted MFS family arabinose efflux permease